ncbi:hypothetical protein SAMN05421799_103283 [Alicyclobacillus vulcanalis]|uniref:Uncharacterized protein n=1 Tax=Alicyclobacillus vulcanalis TaxID=252246 RepID=A0A1N7LNM3_9BACL|nr:hypothetical protein SAMN05421799_103283 [Alicyclobacillus vulcanalis]
MLRRLLRRLRVRKLTPKALACEPKRASAVTVRAYPMAS